MASISAGLCVNGSELTFSVSAGASFTTSVSARYLIAGDACVINQSTGNLTGVEGGGGGAGATGRVIAVAGVGAAGAAGDIGLRGLFGGNGRVTLGLAG